MSHILNVGIAVLDIVNTVADYPEEDAELRAVAQTLRCGGNAANTARVLAGLGHRVDFAGTLADEPDARHIEAQLRRAGVNTRYSQWHAGGKSPTSYITLNRQNGSRTIVHYRDLPEYGFEAFADIPLEPFDWLHFEGRNIEQTRRMLELARSCRVDQTLSVEIEKDREGIETLFPLADILLFSRAFAKARGFEDAAQLFAWVHPQAPEALLVCAWGEAGAWAWDREAHSLHSPAFPPKRIVDTLGAGDTFNAGMIDALCSGKTLEEALEAACRLAGRKIAQEGLDGLTPVPPDPPESGS